MQTLLGQHWHHLSAEDVLVLLDVQPDRGLEVCAVQQRQQRFGRNVITAKRGTSPLMRWLRQFHHPLLYILLASSALTAILQDVVDAATIFGVVLINAIIGYLQEAKAAKAIEALAQTMVTEATALRAGQTVRLSATTLVPGDLVLLQAGDKVPADLRLLRTRDLQIAEAVLTGESVPVHKVADALLPPETVVADRTNMAYASTLVTAGQGMGVVVATGKATEVGRISHLIATAPDVQTPLTRKIAHFSRVLLYAILALAALTFGVGLGRGQAVMDTLMAAIALAVAAIPEGLPAAVTVTLAIGVARMARRQAIIRRLPAVEALGSTTVICSDKTGTLTQNQMTVQQVVAGGTCYAVTGLGYAPVGQLLAQGAPVEALSVALQACLQAGVLCNDSQLREQDGRWEVQGDPTEGALLVAARKAGLVPEALHSSLPRLDAIPFASQHQYMATLHDAGADSPRRVYVKGALETVLATCTLTLEASGQPIPLEEEPIRLMADRMAQQGLRVLALAQGTLPPGTTHLTPADVAAGLTFLGLQGMSDPPRAEAVAAVRACQSAGIHVKMITGDHALTAAAIARQLGLAGTPDAEPLVLTGQVMATLSDAAVIEQAARTAVFARVTPEQKLRLVEALQAQGHIVAMTGDGVNDAPALQQADIGVAMGRMGTDVAKEAADMVLTDDNFASIVAAVEEGRGIFDNITKIIAWTLPTNLGEGLVILAAILTGSVLPILPAQILWINMTTVGVLGLVLAVEPKEADLMHRPPRPPQAPILTRDLLWRVLLVGALILVGAYGLFAWEQARGASVAEARTVAVNVVVLVEMCYLLNCRSLSHSMFQIGVFTNRWLLGGWLVMVVLQLLFTYAPFMHVVLASAPIGLRAWGPVVGWSLLTFGLIETDKWVRRWVTAPGGREQ